MAFKALKKKTVEAPAEAVAVKKPLVLKKKLAIASKPEAKVAKPSAEKVLPNKKTVDKKGEVEKTNGKGGIRLGQPRAEGAGRKKGVFYEVPEEYHVKIIDAFAEIKKTIDVLEENVTKFLEKGNKSAAKAARENLQDIKNIITPLRKELQDAKENVVQME